MKLFILSLLLSVCTICSAQTEHMKFMGIPIDGTVDSFVAKLKNKGFTYLGDHNGMACLSGEFAATKDCDIVVIRLSDLDQVNSVSVFFPETNSWNEIYTLYITMKDLLTSKYGKPQSVEEFSDYTPSGDRLKYRRLLEDECNYISEYKCENGKIQLKMQRNDYQTAATIMLRYIDKANANKSLKKIMDDL